MKPGSSRESGGSWWRSDVAASLVVFLVALPLCMGVALASGLPAQAGLITGILGGIVVGAIAGSPLQVSGPAAGLIVLVFEITQRRPGDLGIILVLAGVLQLLAGAFRLAQWFRIVSPAVIQGMLAGIGALILVGQMHVMVGGVSRSDGLENLLALPETIWSVVIPPENGSLPYAAFLGLLTIGVMVLWQEYMKKRLPLPGTLVAVIVASIVASWLGLAVTYVDVPHNLVNLIGLESLTHAGQPAVLGYALAFALIASAESLLCATAVDQLHKGPRTQYDRELAAQGIGNMLCGVLGGVPMTGVIVRSSANIDAGARTRLSAILHGVWILAFVALLPWLLGFIPIASLAAILVYTGVKLISVKAVRELFNYGKSEVAIYAATFATIVLKDLLTGVIVGVILSGIKLLYIFTHLSIRRETSADGRRTTLHLRGAATFLRLPQLAAALETGPSAAEMHIHLEKLDYIDHACLDLMMSWARQHQAKGGKLVIDWESLHACFRQGPQPARVEPDKSPTPAAVPHPPLPAPIMARRAS